MRSRWRTIVTICFIVLLLVPLVGAGDGVPISSYSMYARPRAGEVTFVVAVGQQVGGELTELSPISIAGTPDPLIVESYLRREVEGGRTETLCERIADRAADTDVVAIQIRFERHDVVDRVLNDSPPISSELLASCLVP